MTDYTSLLGKSDQSWKQIATALLSEQQSKNKKSKRKQRRALVGALALSAWDNNKVNNVIRNLEDAKVDEQFAIAKATTNWEAYNTFISEDRKFVEAGGKEGDYFTNRAAAEFFRLNPNFDELYKNQSKRHKLRTNEIEKLAKTMQEEHIKQKKTLGINTGQTKPYLTKDEFMKPYEDFYRAKERRLTDPSELSGVHKVLGLVGPGRRRRKELDQSIADKQQTVDALNKTYSELLDPKIYGTVPSYYDRDAIKYTQTDALDMIQQTHGQDPTLVRKLQNSIKLLVAKTDDPNTAVKEKTDISDTALTAVIIVDTMDFDLLTEKAIQAKDDFEEYYKTKYDKEEKPEGPQPNQPASSEYTWYDEEEAIFIAKKLELSSTASLELRQALLNKSREEAKDKPNIDLIRQYDQVIEKATALAGFEAATAEYMRIQVDPTRKEQMQSSMNPDNTLTEEEVRTQFLRNWMDTLNAARKLTN